MTSAITRRDFVRLGALCAGGGWVAACTDPLSPEQTPGALSGEGTPKNVAIVGAGMSGLVAAFELARAGHEVRVLEARDRIGGRVLTLRSALTPDHVTEAGAARIRPEHDLTLGYARHFGLETTPFYPRSGDFLEVAAGRRVRLGSEEFRAQRPDYVKLPSGTDGLPRAFAEALSGRIALATAVARIEHGSAEVRLTADDGRVFTADRVLVTSPVPVLDRIEFDPGLSAGKREAIAGGFDYQQATRVFVRFADRFWETDGLNGWAVTDWPEEVWHPTWDVPGSDGRLLTYVRGARARALDALGDDERIATVLAHWEDVFPGATAAATNGVSHSWQDDPWSRAAWAQPSTDQDARLTPELARPERALHFAGEHLSSDRGWMQGALASGIRAAQEIHSA